MNRSRVGILPARKDQERASWWHRHLGGTGILVAPASWWYRHLGGTGILPVTIFGRAGYPPYSYSFLN
ncbi:hypothetical protein [Moorena sp. SIO3A2]|uniref:hypothetical protein n=1 Tax=Moorena sp. SIO3A2 TaxID=2607841 RepID=UPI0013BE82D2|nr:hypothetical protein [Moorena sp. SIO3A2]NEQ15061.1 hypothetical protein [Moorena sp. SIO3E2]NER90460.1 hypothetical protein [Moorena sp. SIO3A2]